MKIAEIRKLETDKLIKQVIKVRLEIAELKKGIVMGESTNVRAVRSKRKQLARMLTVVSEKLEKEKI
jgi:ribosomal protein L29